MEKIVDIDPVGRVVLPKAMREALNLGSGGPATVRLAPGGVIEIRAMEMDGRQVRRVGKFLVVEAGEGGTHNAAADVRAERDSR